MQYKKIDEEDFCSAIINDIKDGTCISRPMIAMRKEENIHDSRIFFIPDEKDKLIQFLFDLSFSKNITHVNRVYSDNPLNGINLNLPYHPKKARVYAYELYYMDSVDGQTNITPDFVGELNRLF